jgi:predicted tellurium resistance membrane protein TerC
MKKYIISPFALIFVGFILLNMLAGVFYRYNEMFYSKTNLYLWFTFMVIAFIILIWGIKEHINHYEARKLNINSK